MSYRGSIKMSAEQIAADHAKTFGKEPSDKLCELLLLFANGTATAYEEGFQDGLKMAQEMSNESDDIL